MRLALRTSIGYVVFGTLWILLTDYLLSKSVSAQEAINGFQSAKGLLFVALSGVVMYLLVRYGERKHDSTEGSLHHTQERFAAFFRSSPAPTYISTLAQGTILDANDSFLEMMGYTRDEVVGRTSRELGIWADIDRRNAIAERLGGKHTELHEEVEFRTRSGETLHIMLSVAPHDINGEACLLNFAFDVTRIKHVEQSLVESEARFRRLTQSNLIGVAINDLSGQVGEANDMFLHIVGYDRDDLASGRVQLGTMTPPEYFRHDARAQTQLMESAVALPFEKQLIRKDGSRVPVLVGATLLEQSANKCITFVLDQSEQKQADQRLRASEERFRLIAQCSNDLIYEWRVADSQVHWFGDIDKCLGYEPGEFPRTTEAWTEAIHPDDRVRVQEATRLHLKDGTPLEEEYRMRTKQGNYIHWTDSGIAVRDENGNPVRWVGATSDITRRKHAEDENLRLSTQMEHRLRRITAVHEIDLAITASVDLTLTLSVFLEQVISHLYVDAAAVRLYAEPTLTLHHAAARGMTPNSQHHNLDIRLGEDYAGKAALDRRAVYIADLREVRSNSRVAAGLEEEGFITYYAMPLLAKGQLQGVLELFHRSVLEVDDEWRDFLETLATQAAIAIDSVTLFNDLQRSNFDLMMAYDTTLEGWSHALDLRDRETEGHSRRVTEGAVLLAQAMSVPQSQMIHVRRGALLHDIGKMGVPDGILLKPGALTDEEWAIMKMHPQYAYDLLAQINFLRPALDIPFCHHEKWDGSGYPRGIARDQIPLAARIFAIVDVYDALTSNRPYRAAWTRQRAIEYIEQQSGTHFDPRVVAAFLALNAPITENQ